MKTFRLIFAVSVAALAVAGSAGSALAQQSATACSTTGLVTGTAARTYKVAQLTTTGIPCAKARVIARTVATQVTGNGSLSVPGVVSFSMSTQTCTTGCASGTSVTLVYPSGSVTIVITRRAATVTPTKPTTPTPAPTPGSTNPLFIA